MSLAAGTRLGPFEIVAPIGAGGMGEVYRARDTRLHRDVAVKILATEVAMDATRRARFEREAQAVAALNHPNILAIYETGDAAGVLYIATELLDGETLRERLERGALPVRKAIDIAVQIARGLAAAHDKGLVHRDLKPENVFLLADGQGKILDFGLARPAPTGSGATATVALTDAGTTMGTVGYMSPEQVRGQAVDARADLFALGAVLFEMLTGRRAFQRDTAADTISAILNQDPPDITSARADLPPALERVVRHCLEKNPAERFQTARDVAFALAAFSDASVSHASGAVRAVGTPRRWPRIVVPVLLVLVALAAGALVDRTMHPAPAPVAFEGKTWDPQWITNARFAPDGQTIVFSAAPTGNVPGLFVIRQGTVVSEPIGEPGTQLLSISSTGELAVLTGARLAIHRIFRGTLARMSMDSGPRPLLTDVVEADWSPDGAALAVTRRQKESFQLEYPIGRVLYRRPSGYVSDPRVSPDGSQVAFFDHDFWSDDRGFVKVVDARGVVRTLAGEYWGLQGLTWCADGRSLCFSGSGAGGDSYQPQIVNVTGTPRPRPLVASAGGMIVLDVARDGRLLVMRTDTGTSIRALVPGETAEREMPWLDFPLGGWLSPDGKSLLFTDQNRSAGANYAVALRALDSGKVVRLGPGTAGPLSPDGLSAVALLPSTGDMMIYPIGAGEAIKLGRGPIERYTSVAGWFPDGRRVLVCGTERARPPRCYAQDLPSGTPRPVSPDGLVGGLIAADGRTMVARSIGGEWQKLVVDGNAATPVKGTTRDDYVVGWTPDLRALLVSGLAVPARVERVDLATGTRTLEKEMAPPAAGGVTLVNVVQWIDGGRGYVYTYRKDLSKLFVVTGVQR